MGNKILNLLDRKVLFSIILLFTFGALEATPYLNSDKEHPKSSGAGNNNHVKPILKKDTLLIITETHVFVTVVDQEKSKQILANKNLLKAINKSRLEKGLSSNYQIIFSESKDQPGLTTNSDADLKTHNGYPKEYFLPFLLFLSITLPIILLIFFFRKNKSTAEDTKNYPTESTDDNYKEETKDSDDHSKPMLIPEETVSQVLSGLAQFEKTQKYLRSDISLSELANDVDTNKIYLSEILELHKDKRFVDYINGLRIAYITEMIYKNSVYREYKISSLAKECGFSSREEFVLAFKKETGISPSYFIAHLKKENNSDNQT
ncbi:helix-turn-helix domain-containing protein [Epilithonimonas arachidiradicis]|uniref:AraC-like DNA-binding protein n=1 Tax=Epilithonimonas arachidiradicis TaxID=1617282 RepID=A0A420DE79_9FLAO|nr:helix-turn-helix domain-containing protein [Epilithonimonas arachidiradicis]RKE90144.1 AraC-like DNA-binding protein [Epilithonimonas arachidiradicis]GGG48074.1 hypothetical protein GCM10007332_07000 [Epilithonimonas arachidiradicis]